MSPKQADSGRGPANPPAFPQQTAIPQNSGPAATRSRILSANSERPIDCIHMGGLGLQRSMTLRIERLSGRRRTQIRLSGELRAEQLDQLKDEIERAGPRVALDLEEVHLVDIEAVRFLNACVAHGLAVLHGSPYIKEWMFRERGS
jgi:hypothetical protein